MKKVGILTSFTGHDHAYSLCNIVADQLRMLLGADYAPVLLARPSFRATEPPWNDPRVEIRHIENFTGHNSLRWDPKMAGEVAKVAAGLRTTLHDIDVVLTHDLIYQPAELVLNMAARQYAEEREDLRWLHWVHSATSPAIIGSPQTEFEECKKSFPHSFVVFPNAYSKRRIARNFGYEEDWIKCVPHATDPYSFLDCDPKTKELGESVGLLDADVVVIYPLRMDRGKQPHLVIEILAGFLKFGRRPLGIFCDFHSTGGDKVTYRKECQSLAQVRGIGPGVVFTSQWQDGEGKTPFRGSCPRKVVADLMKLSDVLILPSVSETYSLVAQEAALCGNILVLNGQFPPMRSIYGDAAIYREFNANIDMFTGLDGDTKTEYHPSARMYMADVAMRILYEIEHTNVVNQKNRIRRTRNPRYVFRRYLEPLLYAEVNR